MAPSEAVRDATVDFLASYPDSEAALADLVEVDSAESTWTFDDIDLDSGRFGELVSREIAVSADNGEYRLQDRAAVAQALRGEAEPTPTESGGKNTAGWRKSFNQWLHDFDVDKHEVGGLIASLALVVVARLISYGSVMRGEYVVSPANDPYYFRYWQAQLLERSNQLTDIGLVADIVGDSRPFSHVMNWWLTELLGGTAAAADTVAAWLPIVGAVATGIVLYLLTKVLTGDVRAGLATVAFFSLAPVHVVYTQIGFIDHNIHQYFWLSVLALTLTWFAVDLHRRYERSGDGRAAAWDHATSRTTWLVAGVLPVAVVASVFAWAGSALTFIPVAGYIVVRVVIDVREEIPPLVANAPLIAGLALGGVFSFVLHVRWGWSETALAVIPALVAGGAVAVAGVGEEWRHRGLQPARLPIAEAVVAGGLLGVLGVIVPDAVERLRTRANALFFREEITETTSLFTPDLFVILGPVSQIGISFYLGLAVLAAVTWIAYQRYEPGWTVLACFSWYYILVATIQVRFAAKLTLFISVFAGVGCLYLLAKLEIVRSTSIFGEETISEDTLSFSLPRGQQALYLVVVLILILSANFIYAPTLIGQATHSDGQFETALAIDEHVTTTDRGYPASAVEARWGDIRMYNYFVNGEARDYNSNYERVLTASHPDKRWQGLREGGRYLVITKNSGTTVPGYQILFEGIGVGFGDVEETAGRFQPVYVGEDVRAFTAVAGAKIRVRGASGTEVTAETTVAVNGTETTYERSGVVENGAATIRVAHPGVYQIGEQTVAVSEKAVLTGSQVTVE